jgi:hypothetical protein
MPPPPLQPAPQAPPCPGRPVAPAPVRSSLRSTASMPRPSSTPRSNYSPAWLAPPCRRLLCSWRHLELLHALTVLSPRPRSGQADTPLPLRPGRPPRPGLCHLSLQHAPATPRYHLTTSHHHQHLRSACRPPNSGRRLWTSPARLPPLDTTSRLGPPPLDAISRLPRPLLGIAPPPTIGNECPMHCSVKNVVRV